jgi:predicted signal transduction protein with EAL and GGDEF domain
VSDVTQGESAKSIVTAVISLAKSLKFKVIAEGVQTKEQSEILRDLRCDEAQGFLFSPALVSGEFDKLVHDWKPEYVRSQETLGHLGGKKLGQHGTEFSPKQRKGRRHPAPGFRGKK